LLSVQKPGKLSKKEIIAIVLLVGLSLGLRLYRIGHENFWIDEVHQVMVSAPSPEEILANYRADTDRKQTDQAPLSQLITHYFLSESNPEFFARLPAALFGTLAVASFFIFARQLFPVSTCILAVLLLALSPLHVWYSQEARWYSQWTFVTTLSYVFLFKAIRERSSAHWIGYGTASVINLYTFIYSPFVFAAQGLSTWLTSRRQGQSSRALYTFALVMLLVLVAALPVVLMVSQSVLLGVAKSGTQRTSSILELPYTLFTYSVGFTIGPSLRDLHGPVSMMQVVQDHPLVIVTILVFAPISVMGLVSIVKQRQQSAWILPWLLLPPLLVFLISSVVSDMTYQVRYTWVSLPAFLLVIATGVNSLSPGKRRMALTAILGLSLISISNYYWNEAYDKAHIRDVIQHIVSAESETTQVLVVGQIYLAMPYYGNRPEIQVISGCGPGERLNSKLDISRAVWLVSGRDWKNQRPSCMSKLMEYYSVSQQFKVVGVDAWRLTPAARRGQN